MRSTGYPSLYYRFITFLKQQGCKFETGGMFSSSIYIINEPYVTYVFHFDNDQYLRISKVSNEKNKFQLFIPASTVKHILDKLIKFDKLFTHTPSLYQLTLMEERPRQVKRGLSGHEKPAKPSDFL